MSKELISFKFECPAACNSAYVLLKQKNIDCFKSGKVNENICHIYVEEKDLSSAIKTVPVLAECEQRKTVINTKFIICDTGVWIDDTRDSGIDLTPYHRKDSFDTYEGAKKAFIELVNTKEDKICIIKTLYDENNDAYLNEETILAVYFNLYDENT